jgi:hypothetical protein
MTRWAAAVVLVVVGLGFGAAGRRGRGGCVFEGLGVRVVGGWCWGRRAAVAFTYGLLPHLSANTLRPVLIGILGPVSNPSASR